MKLKNFFMYMTAVGLLFGCSDNEPDLNNQEPQPTTMSFVVETNNNVFSKADPTDATIDNLVVAIFGASGKNIYVEETTGGEGVAEKKDIEVEAGGARVLILANVDFNSVKDKTLTQLQDMTTELSKEKNGRLTMSSPVMDVTFQLGVRNMIGYSSSDVSARQGTDVYPSLGGNPVKLYRSVSKIQLSQLTLNAKSADPEAYGTPVSFQLKEIFIANAKGYSQLVSKVNDSSPGNKYLSIETGTAPAGAKLWVYGACKELKDGDILKTIQTEDSDQSNDLVYDFQNSGPLLEIKGGVDATHFIEENKVLQPIGKYFYVYENEDKTTGEQTLLVLKGDYTYIPANGTPVDKITMNDRYYAVPVNYNNQDNQKGDKNIIRIHDGIIRNNKYDLRLTLHGPGSEEPYQPEYHLYFNAKVVVSEWSEVSIGEKDKPQEVN